MNQREYWLAIDAEHLDLARKGVSDWSPVVEVTVAGDDLAPSAPSISAAAADQAIDLTLTKPSTNADGTTCVDFKEFKVYYSSSSGIDVTNPTTYDGYFYTPSTSHTYPATAETYFVATAWDKNGNESAASSETSATPTSSGYSPSVDDYTSNFAGIYVGDGIIGIEFQPPKSTWVRFAGWKLYYDVDTGTGWGGTWTLVYTGSGPGFLHKGLTTAYAYKYKLAVLGEDGTETTGTIDDNAGAGYTPNASDNSAITPYVLTERLVATEEVRTAHLAAGSVTADKISVTNLSAINADLGSVTAGSIVVTDGTNTLWFNDASDGGLAVGGTVKSSAPFRVDSAGNLTATSATIQGTVTIGAGSSGISNLSDAGDLATLDVVGNAYITDVSASKITAGTITAQTIILATDATPTQAILKSSNYVAGSAGWQIDSDGNAEFNDVTVRGALITGTGSSISGAYISNIDAGTITTGTLSAARIAAGSITAAKLYIDGDVNFAADSIQHSIYGLDWISCDTAGQGDTYIQLTANQITLDPGTTGSIRLGVSGSTGTTYLNSAKVIGAFKYSGATVFGAAAAPTAWTNLDLSSYVGARNALVLLRIYNGSTSTINYRFRPDGWTAEQGASVDLTPGIFSTRIGTSLRYNYVWCMTSSSGIIEWDADVAGSTTIMLVAYIN